MILQELPDNTRRIYLIRHANTIDRTTFDPAVSEKGLAQLRALRGFFQEKALDIILTSELQRARTTAQALLFSYPDIPLVVDPRLNEVHTVGNWKEFSEEDVRRFMYKRMWKPDHFCVKGESLRFFHRRVAHCWKDMIEGNLLNNAQNIAIVTHNDVLSVLISLLFDFTEDDEIHFSISYPHAAVSELWIADRRADPTLPDWIAVIKYLCYSDYLQPSLITY